MKIKFIVGIIIFIPILIIFLYYENNTIEITEIEVSIDKDLGEFEGYRIVHLSDLHNKSFGNEQEKIIPIIEELNPDIIIFTGDLIDSRRKGIDNGVTLLEKASEISEVYYVTGNHEERTDRYKDLYQELKRIDINILDDMNGTIVKEDKVINIYGIRDKSTRGLYGESINWVLDDFSINDKDINILLAHRPSFIEYYKNYPFDLVFSGHAHGGQIRLPIIGGVLSPDQGLLPEYDSGLYLVEDTQLVVSRGLGNSLFPQRVFNKPEIILTILRGK